MKRVAVLFGGVSSEHEVSLISASSVINNIPSDRYQVYPVGITKDGRWLSFGGDLEKIQNGSWSEDPSCMPALFTPDRSKKAFYRLEEGAWQPVEIDAVFPVLHGRNGEDGSVQGLCQLSGIPCVGCGVTASAACMDKALTNALLDHAGIRQAKWLAFLKPEYEREREAALSACEEALGYPCFVKPANAGSSVGITKAHDREELRKAFALAFRHDRKVVVEENIDGREIEVAVLGNHEPQASLPGEIVAGNDFYDYDAKYISGTSILHIPADVSGEKQREIRETAVRVYETMGCEGLSRVDFFLRRSDGAVLLNELNTIPGFTSISMYPKLFAASGIPYPELLDRLITLAIEEERTDG